ncbi:vacuolar protein-sorting-associated protein 33 homolog isoform X9 [Cucumis melo]|uniref:Vacuolar protein-sorting-associated protein 33 homolog isoform X10 n=1 Tax=Cucumis melo TaxID=3656 RepID=A0ABM3KTQ0_CUCME|nr:vacuolar protein-sorting-associated protein 33 homolog isoform X8 [Cucumis melo]XP_050941157.1 vacuolar protein-sorting-associated protein 33 homolog isoform X8 [Cucumis melo]XP_050941158.1 vacuolar protein-sorting-associated protein 33 homolog isoform X8 [Cucumis melo]XP_050941159.1 vacuolar protein-sorting-associated protein 33 homolog isoform X9 [Cucumis melo]XP_050941160.1 vacuolar protein-sorting-associated protein 33 homolog isoform X10 [Cucumis melo]XP_050941161.1 vacuolar protein-so
MLVFFWSCQLLEPLQSPLPNRLFSFGAIPNVRAKGRASVRVADILNHLQTKEPINSNDMVVPEINTLILIFREVDMVTPMCSQLTYEGLFDEFLHVSNGSVELDSSIMGAQQDGKKIKVPLNSRYFQLPSGLSNPCY